MDRVGRPCRVDDPAIKIGAKITVAVNKGLPAITEAAKTELVVAAHKAIAINNGDVIEGASGFYLEVV